MKIMRKAISSFSSVSYKQTLPSYQYLAFANINMFYNSSFKSFARKPKNFDPYLVLDVNRKANWADIKKQYYKLARQYHPDLNQNDERSQHKFVQIKEAYEYFERKYNPAKYKTNKPAPEFEYNEESETKESTQDESIRDKRKTPNDKTYDFKLREEVKEAFSEKGFTYNENNPEDYQLQSKRFFEAQQKEAANQFLKNKGPNPRSYQMIDRLGLKADTIQKGKFFGAEDYLGFFAFTYILFIILYMVKRQSYNEAVDYDNIKKDNIYNILDTSKAKIVDVEVTYEDNEITPLEQKMRDSKDYSRYINQEKDKIKELLESESDLKNLNINSLPAIDLRSRFNQSL